MAIVLVRLDSRLIHGQVVAGWVPAMRATAIVVASDQAARDPIQRAAMESAVPPEIGMRVATVADAVDGLVNGASGVRTLVLFARSGDLLVAHDLGFPLTEVNVGNLSGGAGRHALTPSVFVAGEDVAHFVRLHAAGVRMTLQAVPSDVPQDLWTVLRGRGLVEASGS